MKEYLDIGILTAHTDHDFTEDEAFDILLEVCVFIDEKFGTTSTGVVKIISEEDFNAD
jgi:hypothetical protein